jgi:hypothetical protein
MHRDKYTEANNMIPVPFAPIEDLGFNPYDWLPKLPSIAQALIALVHTRMQIFILKNGSTGIRGHVANYQQDISSVTQHVLTDRLPKW